MTSGSTICSLSALDGIGFACVLTEDCSAVDGPSGGS
jgi:hypothetical protein